MKSQTKFNRNNCHIPNVMQALSEYKCSLQKEDFTSCRVEFKMYRGNSFRTINNNYNLLRYLKYRNIKFRYTKKQIKT